MKRKTLVLSNSKVRMKTKETIQRKILGGLTDEYVAGWLISNRYKNQSIVVILKHSIWALD